MVGQRKAGWLLISGKWEVRTDMEPCLPQSFFALPDHGHPHPHEESPLWGRSEPPVFTITAFHPAHHPHQSWGALVPCGLHSQWLSRWLYILHSNLFDSLAWESDSSIPIVLARALCSRIIIVTTPALWGPQPPPPYSLAWVPLLPGFSLLLSHTPARSSLEPVFSFPPTSLSSPCLISFPIQSRRVSLFHSPTAWTFNSPSSPPSPGEQWAGRGVPRRNSQPWTWAWAATPTTSASAWGRSTTPHVSPSRKNTLGPSLFLP